MAGEPYVIVTRYRDITHVYGPYPSDQAARSHLLHMRAADEEMYRDGDTPEMSVHKVLSEPPQ